MLNTALLPRPFSCHSPKVAGYEPAIRCRIERVSRSRRNAWRCMILVDDNPMATSHHDTKAAAESKGAAMMEAYTDAHYVEAGLRSHLPPIKTPITQLQADAYVAEHGDRCPHCGSDDLEAGSLRTDAEEIYQPVTCSGCGAAWRDVYTLTDCIEAA